MDELTYIENDWTTSLETAGFKLYRGWSSELATKLVAASREETMLANVPRDAAQRFLDNAAAKTWHDSSKREIYPLFHENDLAGVIWFTLSPRPDLDADYTYAIRMYEISRGKGLAYDFTRAVQTDFAVHTGYKGAVWLETNTDNIPARKLYEKFGYVVVAEHEGRLTFVYRPA